MLRCLAACLLLVIAQPAERAQAAEPLTFARLFAEPGLDGSRLSAPKFNPKGTQVAYLKGSDAAPRRLDLWLYDIESGKSRLLVAAKDISGADKPPPEEQARRERLQFGASGIARFDWSPAGDAIMFPMNGAIYLHRLRLVTTERLGDGRPKINPALSPRADRMAYVSDGDIYLFTFESGRTRRLTRRSDPEIRYGEAEFVAAEEMGRQTGFWWSPDGRKLAVLEVDTRPVALKSRPELTAEGWRQNNTPYPRAGTPNARVRLLIVDANHGARHKVDLGDTDHYIARVRWREDGSGLLVQRQSRDQKILDLLAVDLTGKATLLSRETSPSFVGFADEVIELTQTQTETPALLWLSARDGIPRVYRRDGDGTERPLSPPDLVVDGIIAVDEKANRLFVDGHTVEDPLVRHLYALDLDPLTADAAIQITAAPGVHSTAVSPESGWMLDWVTTPHAPPSLWLRSIAGGAAKIIHDGGIIPAHPYFPYLAAHKAPRFGSIAAADGTPLYYRLLLPEARADGRPAPVLVHLYGGPGVQLVTRSWAPLWYQAALARGYAIFTLDNRGGARRGKAFAEALYQGFGTVDIADQKAGLDFLKTEPAIDRSRIAVYGWSYGGYLALKLAAAEPRIKAVVAGAPVTDWRLYDTHYTERYLGLPGDNAALYDKSGVAADLDRLTQPLLLIHGGADDNVDLIHSTTLAAALQNRGRSFDLMIYPGLTHAPREPAVQRHIYDGMFRFLDHVLAVNPGQ